MHTQVKITYVLATKQAKYKKKNVIEWGRLFHFETAIIKFFHFETAIVK